MQSVSLLAQSFRISITHTAEQDPNQNKIVMSPSQAQGPSAEPSEANGPMMAPLKPMGPLKSMGPGVIVPPSLRP